MRGTLTMKVGRTSVSLKTGPDTPVVVVVVVVAAVEGDEDEIAEEGEAHEACSIKSPAAALVSSDTCGRCSV
jgi:hypothetical protein